MEYYIYIINKGIGICISIQTWIFPENIYVAIYLRV